MERKTKMHEGYTERMNCLPYIATYPAPFALEGVGIAQPEYTLG
jgi:hypothetical protein